MSDRKPLDAEGLPLTAARGKHDVRDLDVERQADELPPAPTAPASPGAGPQPIRLGQRVLAVGNTGEGKSEVLGHLFSIYGGQRLLVDVNDHYRLGPAAIAEGALEVEDVRAIDWRYRTIRYVPRRLDRHEFDDLYAAIFARGRLFVWLDEAEDAAPVHAPPAWLRKTVKQGRKFLITHGAATQRPAGVERSIINQSEHAFVFRMVDPDDLATLGVRLGMRVRELADALAALPQHGYLRHTIGQRQIVAMPPLPLELVRATRRHIVPTR